MFIKRTLEGGGEIETNEIRTLEILTEVSANKDVTQRGLARSLGVGLGLSNKLVQMLIRRGLIEAQRVHRQKHLYFLTPKGLAEKMRIGMRFAAYAMRLVRSTRAFTVETLQGLADAGVKGMVFYGVGDIAEIAFLALEETGIELVGVVDDGAAGEKFLGHLVEPIAALVGMEFDRIAVTCLEPDWQTLMDTVRDPGLVVNLATWQPAGAHAKNASPTPATGGEA